MEECNPLKCEEMTLHCTFGSKDRIESADYIKEDKEMAEEEKALEKIKEFSADGALARVDEAIRFIEGLRSRLKEDEDYGKHPGYTKPSLEKPGAEKIALALNCASTIIKLSPTIIDDRYGLKEYELVVGLKNRVSGEICGEGVGYGRAHEKDLYAYDKEAGRRIIKAERAEWANNTALKMAYKSGLICASLTAGALSGYFTQDLDKAPEKDQKQHSERTESPSDGLFQSKTAKDILKDKKTSENPTRTLFLGIMNQSAKKLGQDKYFEILGKEGFEKAKEIPEDDETMNKVICAILQELKEITQIKYKNFSEMWEKRER